jgi:hypothetical protein
MNYTHIRFAFYETYTSKGYAPVRLPKGASLKTEGRMRAWYVLAAARHVRQLIPAQPDQPGSRILTISWRRSFLPLLQRPVRTRRCRGAGAGR